MIHADGSVTVEVLEPTQTGPAERVDGRGLGSRLGESTGEIEYDEPTLEQILPGRVETVDGAPPHYVGETSLGEVPRLAEDLERLWPHLFGDDGPEVPAPEEVLFLDIEGTGLWGTPLFLVGLASVEEGELRLRQRFARTYPEEAGVLAGVGAEEGRFRALVTFNGKSYDVPVIRDRAAFHGADVRLDLPHVDLLHPARRLWREVLPDCKLGTLERHVLGRHRVGDVPSAMVPRLYHEFVHDDDPRRLQPVFHHNAVDLLTLAELLGEVGRGLG
jgi:uncharacterized protein YprB with RNaseH-like and TPR domain